MCTHTESCQIIVNLKDIPDGISNSADDTVNDMHNSIGCNLVAIDNSGAVHSHHLHVTSPLVLYLFKTSFGYNCKRSDTHPIGVMVNIETKVVVHGGDFSIIL